MVLRKNLTCSGNEKNTPEFFYSDLQIFQLVPGRYEILDNNNSVAAFMTVYFDDNW